MRRLDGVRLGVGILCVSSAACGNPDQLYRHRDAGAPPSQLTGTGATSGGAGANGLGGGAGSGFAGGGGNGLAGSTAGNGGMLGGMGGSTGAGGGAAAAGSSGTGGASAAAGASGAGGASGAAGGTSGAAGASVDAATDQSTTACASTPDCHCESHGGHAYKFCGAGRGFVAAAADCTAQGMRLIRVDDEAENQWAYDTKVAKGFPGVWIGADDIEVEGDWRWADDTPFWTGKAGAAGSGPVNALFNAWQTSPPQPDQSGDEDCAGYDYGNDRWADLPCTNHNAYICEAY